MRPEPQSIDLVANKNDERIAVEIETGKNSVEQIIENISKCIRADFHKIYAIATTDKAYKKINEALVRKDLTYDPRIKVIKAGYFID